MRQPKGVFLPPARSGRLHRADIYRTLRMAILEGALSPGDRLPSSRRAATDYGVSRGLMEEVFTQLTDEGLFERSIGRGTFVASELAALQRKPLTGEGRADILRSVSPRGFTVAHNAACREPNRPVAFNAGTADTAEFPWKIWCRLQSRATRELGSSALGFADPRGLPELRSALSRYLGQFRGVRCTPQQVVVFSSAQQALSAIAILLINRGDKVWVEDPCYLGARAAFDLAGAVTVPVTVDGDGLLVKDGIRRASDARLAYVTPSHQYPTGVVLGLERRIELLRWAARNRSWVVEDDYDGEFRYSGQPLAPLYSLSAQPRVVYLGTLNKSMFVSLRVAYVVVPEELVELLANIRTQMDGFGGVIAQMTTALFMEEGYLASHLRNMRTVYKAKREALINGLAVLRDYGWTWSDNPAGMNLLVLHRNGEYVRRIARASTLQLAILSRYRTVRAEDDGLFLRFGALDIGALRAGVKELVSVAQKMDQSARHP